MIIELPRNFSFFSRLPEIFRLQVIKLLNKTPQGFWYEVKIQGHLLNIRSKVPLKEGKVYSLRQKNPLELQIIKEEPQIIQEEIQEKTKEAMETTKETFSQLKKMGGEATLEKKWTKLLLLISQSPPMVWESLAKTQEKNGHISVGSMGYYFEWGTPVHTALFFRKKLEPKMYDLFLFHQTRLLEPWKEKLYQELPERLPMIDRIFLVTYSQIKHMAEGLDVRV